MSNQEEQVRYQHSVKEEKALVEKLRKGMPTQQELNVQHQLVTEQLQKHRQIHEQENFERLQRIEQMKLEQDQHYMDLALKQFPGVKQVYDNAITELEKERQHYTKKVEDFFNLDSQLNRYLASDHSIDESPVQWLIGVATTKSKRSYFYCEFCENPPYFSLSEVEKHIFHAKGHQDLVLKALDKEVNKGRSEAKREFDKDMHDTIRNLKEKEARARQKQEEQQIKQKKKDSKKGLPLI